VPDTLTQGPPPTWREAATYQLRDLVGYNMAKKMMNAADYTPLGAIFAANEAGAQLRAGRKGAAAIGLGGALLAGLPLPAAKSAGNAAKAAKKALAMDEASRMARAAEQGFDTSRPLYHATKQSFDEFKVGPTGAIYAAPDASVTTPFTDGTIARPGDAPNVMPVFMRTEKAFDLGSPPQDVLADLAAHITPTWNGKRETERGIKRAMKAFESGDFSSAFSTSGSYVSERMRQFLKAKGFDSVVSRNADGSVRAVAALEPEQVRSRFAAFDPAKRNSRNLLAGVAGAGIVAPLTIGQMSQQQPAGGY
jgi:hypothetical protein